MSAHFTRLTPAAIRALKPGLRIAEHGIVVEGLPGGDVRFLIEKTIAGKRVHRVVGLRSAGVNRTQVEEIIGQLESDARRDRFVLPKGRKLPQMFGSAAAEYLDRLEQSGGKNIAVKRRHLHGCLATFFGSMRLRCDRCFCGRTVQKGATQRWYRTCHGQSRARQLEPHGALRH